MVGFLGSGLQSSAFGFSFFNPRDFVLLTILYTLELDMRIHINVEICAIEIPALLHGTTDLDSFRI